jgi:hypothetical protein
MRRITLLLLFSSLLLFVSSLPSVASDCTGPWQKLHNLGGQSPCAALGLDSNRGVCRPGDTYETLCDDIQGGKYRICQGPRRCEPQRPSAPPGHLRPKPQDCTGWDYQYNRPCPPGTRNTDCRGGCDSVERQNDCTGWDYNYNQPCPRGFINRDCRGGCEPR